MPIHHNADGTWQWGHSGKKYKSREDAVKQMRAIFASGYREPVKKSGALAKALKARQILGALADSGR